MSGPSRSLNSHQLATCCAVVCYAPLSKLMPTRVSCLLTSHSQGLLIVLPPWIKYPQWTSQASTKLFITYSSINIKARHSDTICWLCCTCHRCAARGVGEIHTLILTAVTLVHLAEGYKAHKYSTAITHKVKHIVLFLLCIYLLGKDLYKAKYYASFIVLRLPFGTAFVLSINHFLMYISQICHGLLVHNK